MAVTVEEEILSWGAGRPAWNMQVLIALASGAVIDNRTIEQLGDHLTSGACVTLAGLPPAAPRAVAAAPCLGTVTVAGISGVTGVNALTGGEHLTFARSGLTVVYGDNGSGKSGYARLLKCAVRARHREEILADVFADQPADPGAVVHYAVDEVACEHIWPTGSSAALHQVAFYDEACGDSYVSRDMDSTYRPAALTLLDGLIDTCDRVHAELDARLAVNATQTQALPQLPATTSTGALLTRLHDDATASDLEVLRDRLQAAAAVPDDAGDQLAALDEEHLRLRTSDPRHEATRHLEAAGRREAVADHLRLLDTTFGTAAQERLNTLAGQARQLRAAATIASSTDFADEPVPGVGTATWRALWEAARAFSETQAYPGRAFPAAGDDDACVLCHQDLDGRARDRLDRFEAFMRDDTQSRARAAETDVTQAVRAALVTRVLPSPVAVVLQPLIDAEDRDAELARMFTAAHADRRAALEQWDPAAGDLAWPAAPPLDTADALSAAALADRAAAAAVDAAGYAARLEAVTSARAELQARVDLAAAGATVAAEFDRRLQCLRLLAAKRGTDTAAITRKSSELARHHITDAVRGRFAKEVEHLRLDRLTLRDVGGRKGQLLHRAGFHGAAREAPLQAVLSEGEQTALGLAGFFTEACLDQTRSCLVFDDPVCSLDHHRRARVAHRLAELATDRQVIVFTHDAAFATELGKAAERTEAPCTPRSVERAGGVTPGVCKDKHPWNAKDGRQRLADLEADLAGMSRQRPGWDADQYDAAVGAWAGRLSSTWERIISLEVLGRVVDRGAHEVRPRMFRLLARITHEDDVQFQSSYGRISQWADRHDKSDEIGYVTPPIEDLREEVSRVREWVQRVTKYAT